MLRKKFRDQAHLMKDCVATTDVSYKVVDPDQRYKYKEFKPREPTLRKDLEALEREEYMKACVGQYEVEPKKSKIGGYIAKEDRLKMPELDLRGEINPSLDSVRPTAATYSIPKEHF